MDIFKLGDKILALLEAVFGFWNNQISLVFAMLGQSPVSFKGGGPWAVIEGIEPVFVAVGSSLVVLFFVIGFCSESIDVKDEMRFESIFRMLIRLGLAEWFVANNVTIMKAFFTSIGNLVGLISAGTTTQLAIDSTQADIIKGLGFGESLVMLILTALLAIIIIICGFFIIYTVYFRFLKILIIVPLGAIACSTMAGNRMVSHTMATYCKYFLSCVFEAVTMALAIVVCNAFINAGLPAFTGSYADWAQTLIYLCEMTFTIAMTVGSVKGAQTLTSKAYRLGEIEEAVSDMEELIGLEDDIAEIDDDFQIVVSGWSIYVESMNLTLRQGIACVWDAEEGLFMPDFDVTIVYEGNIETQEWLYYEQDGMVVTLCNWLNGRLSCEQIEQLWCELIIPEQNKEQKESEE